MTITSDHYTGTTPSSDEHVATIRALHVLDLLLAADAADDEAAVGTAFRELIACYVNRDDPDWQLAATRLGALCVVLVRGAADRLRHNAPPCQACDGPTEYVIRNDCDGEQWADLDPAVQIAVGATVEAMNGRWPDAHQLVYHYALAAGPGAMTKVLVHLIAFYGAAREQRPATP